MKLGEVCLHTNDVIRLADFYKALLGVDNGSNDAVHQFILTDGTTLSIFNDGSTRPGGDGRISLAFTVADVDAEHARLAALGATVLEKPATRPWGARNMHFLDPDGNHLYFRTLPETEAKP